MSAFVIPPEDELQPVGWRQVDDACCSWVADTLADQVIEGNIIWERQKIAQPSYPYISLFRDTSTDEGGIDEIRQRSLDADDRVVGVDPTAGPAVINEEIVYQPIRWTLTIQAHADPAGGGNDPACNPMFLLSRVKRSLGLTTVIQRLKAAGISIVEAVTVGDTSVVVGGEWISRATLDVILRTASVMSERVGFIEKVELKSDQLGVDTVVDAS